MTDCTEFHGTHSYSMTSLTPNFTQISQETWKVRVETHILPYVKYDFLWAAFYETQVCLTFCTQLLYHIS